ncbi:hypothetical protein C3B51_22525 [Pseudoalteromonas rubra]|uniref:Permease n=1 Tax=Pseudoalteromonas rubra TaxID=43658 RepID=A0A4Q7DX85_9GAMM|nr:ABC transporter permease [Pseudoalteromonas rubra]RZM71496.1 hypothetical protein C3B51_22525 [Pseudoalteromonas rubra]
MGFLIDIRYALRLLAKAPKFTMLVTFILTAGLTISLLTFNMVYTISFKPLQGKDASSIVTPHLTGSSRVLTFEDVTQLGESQLSALYDEYTLHYREEVRLDNQGQGVSLLGEKVMSNFFSFTRTDPLLGRAFNHSDGIAGQSAVVALSYHVWQTVFAGRETVLGEHIRLGGKSYEVVAVMPEGYKFPVTSDLWLPLDPNQFAQFDLKDKQVSVLGRLHDSVSEAQANEELAAALTAVRERRLSQSERVQFVAPTVTHMSLQQQNIEGMGAFIFVGLQSFALAILFMACINTGNLLFSRSIERQKETAIRGALGAKTTRLVRQLVCEGGLITLLGGTLAIVLTAILLSVLNGTLQASLGNGMPFWWNWHLDWQTLSMAVLFILFTFFFASVLPAVKAAKMDINTVLRDGTRGSLGRGAGRLSRIIVTIQVAIIAVLMLSGSLGSSVIFNITDMVTAEKTQGRYAAYFDLVGAEFESPEEKVNFVETAVQDLAKLSSISEADMMQNMGLKNIRMDAQSRVRVDVMGTLGKLAFFDQALLEGRGIDARDNSDNLRVVLISESFAKRHFSGQSALGKQLDIELDDKYVTHTVVGIVSDRSGNTQGMYAPLAEYDELYVSYLQSPYEWVQLIFEQQPGMQSAQQDFYTWLGRSDYQEQFSFIVDLEKNANLYADMLGIMSNGVIYSGVFSLFLALMGVYGVSAASVSMRSHEIGIRRALGAKDTAITILFLKRNMGPLLIGLGIGLVVYVLSCMVFASMIGSKIGLTTYIAIALITSTLLTSMLLLSGYVPTRRAVQDEPVAALRAE